MRRLNPNRVRSKHTYTFLDISELFKRHIRTVQQWKERGLQVLDSTTKPYLVMGSDLIEFLKRERAKRRISLKDGEFYCSRCRDARKSIKDKFRIEETGRFLGKESKQVMIRGECEVCGNQLYRFSSSGQIKFLTEKGVLTKQGQLSLYGYNVRSVNTDIQGTLYL